MAASGGTESPVESIDRALRLLTVLGSGEALSVTDAAASLGVVPSTASRILAALAHREYAIQGPDRRYRAGPALRGRDSGTITTSELRTAAGPGLGDLYRELNETVQLMVLQGPFIRFIDGIECEATLRVGVRNGESMPAHCSAGGKALLAALPNTEVEAIYRPGFPAWPTSKIHDIGGLKRHLTTVRRRGFGINIEETEQGVVGVGRVVLDALGRPVAAITTAIPSVRYRKERLPGICEALEGVARKVETALAGA